MPALYIDMDGVLADFPAWALSQDPTFTDITTPLTPDQQQLIASNPRVFRDLEEMPRARSLMNVALHFYTELQWDVSILTAVPREPHMPWAFQDKMDWMRARWPLYPVRFGPYAEDKQRHCTPGDILIDDKLSNCEQWQAQGGWAIHYQAGDAGGDCEAQLAQRLEQLIRDRNQDLEAEEQPEV